MPVVSAGADRAYSVVQDWLKKRGMNISKAHGGFATPYPFISVWKKVFKIEDALHNPGLFRNFARFEDDGFGYAMRKPKPVVADVHVNFYTNTVGQRDYMEMQVHNLFPSNNVLIPVDFEDPIWYQSPNEVFAYAKILGKQNIRLTFSSLEDTSTLENDGLLNKEIRMTLALVMHGWIPFQPYAVPLAQTIEYVVTDMEDNELVKVVGES